MMKRGLFILVFAILAGAVAFFLMRSHKLAEAGTSLVDSMPELAWVRKDLNLTDSQFAKVSELHISYRPKCMEMCRRISESSAALEALSRNSVSITPELEAAIHEHARVRAECQQAMLRHLYETAATLDEKQARRYLETMLPYALDSAPGVKQHIHSH